MKYHTVAMLLCATALVSACGNKGAPKGQVVATVYGDEITERALQAEMGPAPKDPAAQTKIRDAALERMVQRMILAHAAEEKKLDKTPEFAIQSERMLQQLKATTLQKTLVDQVPPPSQDEVEKFVAEHPKQFAERKLYVVDQVIAIVSDPKVLKALSAQPSFDVALQQLRDAKAPMQRALTTLDPLRIDPRATDQLAALAPGQMIAMSDKNRVLLNRLVEAQPAQLTGPMALNVGGKFLLQQRQQEALGRQYKTLVAQAGDEIQYKGKPAAAKKK
jgi:EpsD family peptidyl-prolyl cis-trans isomerase